MSEPWRLPISLSEAAALTKQHWSLRSAVSGEKCSKLVVHRSIGTTENAFIAWRVSFGEETIILLGKDTDEVVRLVPGTVENCWRVQMPEHEPQLVFDTAEGIVTVTLQKDVSCIT